VINLAKKHTNGNNGLFNGKTKEEIMRQSKLALKRLEQARIDTHASAPAIKRRIARQRFEKHLFDAYGPINKHTINSIEAHINKFIKTLEEQKDQHNRSGDPSSAQETQETIDELELELTYMKKRVQNEKHK